MLGTHELNSDTFEWSTWVLDSSSSGNWVWGISLLLLLALCSILTSKFQEFWLHCEKTQNITKSWRGYWKNWTIFEDCLSVYRVCSRALYLLIHKIEDLIKTLQWIEFCFRFCLRSQSALIACSFLCVLTSSSILLVSFFVRCTEDTDLL